MRLLKWALLVATLAILGGCASNISNVKYTEEPAAPNSRFRTLKALQNVCEVERQLALYTDEARQLWLACPYRFQGQTVPVVAHVGPDTKRAPQEFVYDAATTKIRSLNKVPLRRCGDRLYCANLDALGYMDLSVGVWDNKAHVHYTDLSEGFKEVDAFYSQLDGRAGAAVLDPSLMPLLKPAAVAQRVERLETLAQLRTVAGQLQALGLHETTAIRTALEARRVVLESADFRQQGGFAGFDAAYRLTQAATDLDEMQKLARTDDQKATVFAALVQQRRGAPLEEWVPKLEPFAVTPMARAQLADYKQQIEQARAAELRRAQETRQAEARRQEAQRQAEARKQEESHLAEQRARQAKAEEERCMRDARCRQAVEERRAQCVSKVQSCRAACDRTTGSGSYNSFMANLSAAALARVCYAGCNCETNFGSLLNRFNLAVEGQSAAPSPSVPTKAADVPAGLAKAKVFECKIYCKSATGPTISRRIEAATRKDAAKLASERAGEFCAADAKGYASAVEFKESQCQER